MLELLYMLAVNTSPFLGMAHSKERNNKQILFKVLVNPMRKTECQAAMRVCVGLCVNACCLRF